MLIPKTCDLFFDGALLRPSDLAAEPAWTQSKILLDKNRPFAPLKHPPFPAIMEETIKKISQDATNQQISDLSSNINQEELNRYNSDITSISAFSSLAILIAILFFAKRAITNCIGQMPENPEEDVPPEFRDQMAQP